MNVSAKLRGVLRDPQIKHLLQHGVTALSTKVVAAALGFLFFVMISNVMAVEDYGRFAIGFSLATALSTVAGLGLCTATLRFYPQYVTQGRMDLAHGFLRWAGGVTVVTAVAAAIIGAIGVYAYGNFYDASHINYLYASMALLAVIALSEFAAHLLRAFGLTFMSMAPRDILWRFLVCVTAGILWFNGKKTDSFTILILLSGLLLLLVLWQLVRVSTQLQPVIRGQQLAYDKPVWRVAMLPMWGAAALYSFAQQFDVVLMGHFTTPTESAHYFAALRTANVLGLVLIAGNIISGPIVSRLYHAGDMAGLQKVVKLLTLGIALPTIIGLAILAVIGGFLLSLFNESFVTAYPLLLILGVGFTFDALAGPTGYILQMVGQEKAYLKIMASAYAVTIALQVVLIPIYGSYGAAVPNALGLILANLLLVHKVRKTLGVDPSLLGLFAKARA
jgi:O-antigen/teichoic acid export membrane protein